RLPQREVVAGVHEQGLVGPAVVLAVGLLVPLDALGGDGDLAGERVLEEGGAPGALKGVVGAPGAVPLSAAGLHGADPEEELGRCGHRSPVGWSSAWRARARVGRTDAGEKRSGSS